MKTTELKRLFNQMYFKIGKEKNKDVNWYLNKRPKTITRSKLFEHTAWAIWASAKSRNSARTFLNRAEESGFDWDYNSFAQLDKTKLLGFMSSLHKHPVPEKAKKMWKSIHQIAIKLNSYKNEDSFRKDFFSGKVKSVNLNDDDIQTLRRMNIKFVGEANAHFIIRNMGGEAIKCDRWVERFLKFSKMNVNSLKNQLQKIGIRPGLFDVVFWAYCEKFVGNGKNFTSHFQILVSEKQH